MRTRNTKVFDLKLTPMGRMGEGIEIYQLNAVQLRTQKNSRRLAKSPVCRKFCICLEKSN